ncbi:beta-ketoacyl-ACP synthase III [Frigoriflavimonas asaccharolytica]|uniref:Beta-ketoacyl-[acyl-carrier-protein] synthase III n=1 Tax=Frigoriflavimonas asaccharolytica TaxID=2735899 RepID=A0A8J8G5Q8_9FLAO|nr:beta-ketoacyl-ACP synthase III [Frigoriflavimonas asaccharolytica]NRS91628.1 3-oxoacyl-[acyl-carrier-protein] synthase-3 [Frigoriflavimonas asaccharolytica]
MTKLNAKKIRAYIKSTGTYVPPKILKNDFFEAVGSSDEWIFKNLGIKERRIAEGEFTSDLATKAGLNALEGSGVSPSDIDLIIVATSTPDRQAPSTACFVQEKMGTYQAVAFDISAVCSGGLYGIAIGCQFVETGMYKNVLVIGADVFSSITDWTRKDSVFFGDGAGAILLSATTEDKGFFDFKLHADGRGKLHFNIPAGGCEMPASEETLKNKQHFFQMNGKEVYETATKVLPEAIIEILEDNLMTSDDVNYVIPHQPSIRILQETARKTNIPFEKVMTNMDRYANTSGGTIPIILDETFKTKEIKTGDILLFAAVGSGWTWGTALYKA